VSHQQSQTVSGARWIGSEDRGTVLSYSGSILLGSRMTGMTAIALCYTKFGYVMAADGRARNDPAKPDYEPKEDAQKIFGIVGSDKMLAVGLMGEIIKLPDGSFDLVAEIAKQKARLANLNFKNLRAYVDKLGDNLAPIFDQGWKDGILDPWEESDPNDENDDLIARLIFAGYFNHRPQSAHLEFRYRNNKAEPKADNILLSPGQLVLAAPPGIKELIENDPQFSDYRKPTGPDIPIEGARVFVTSWIEACGSSLAVKLIPKCASVGGDTHVAAITPSEGFHWLTPPRSFDESWPQT